MLNILFIFFVIKEENYIIVGDRKERKKGGRERKNIVIKENGRKRGRKEGRKKEIEYSSFLGINVLNFVK